MNEVQRVKFNGSEIVVIEKGGKQYVAMKPITEALELEWDTQFRNIKNDPVLSGVIVVMTTTGSDGKSYKMVCLPLEYLNGWLFKIPATRYTGKRRETIICYQKSCYRVLYEYFHHGAAVNPEMSDTSAENDGIRIASADLRYIFDTIRQDSFRAATAEVEAYNLRLKIEELKKQYAELEKKAVPPPEQTFRLDLAHCEKFEAMKENMLTALRDGLYASLDHMLDTTKLIVDIHQQKKQ